MILAVDNSHHASTTRASSAESTAVTPVCGFGRPGEFGARATIHKARGK